MGYALRYLPSDPYGRAGAVAGDFETAPAAEAIRRELPNAEHVEVVER